MTRSCGYEHKDCECCLDDVLKQRQDPRMMTRDEWAGFVRVVLEHNTQFHFSRCPYGESASHKDCEYCDGSPMYLHSTAIPINGAGAWFRVQITRRFGLALQCAPMLIDGSPEQEPHTDTFVNGEWVPGVTEWGEVECFEDRPEQNMTAATELKLINYLFGTAFTGDQIEFGHYPDLTDEDKEYSN